MMLGPCLSGFFFFFFNKYTLQYCTIRSWLEPRILEGQLQSYMRIFLFHWGGVPQPLCCSRINCTTNFKVPKVTHQLQIAQSLLGGISEIPPCWSNCQFCIRALKITILFSKQNSGQLLCNAKKLIQSRFPTNWTETEKCPILPPISVPFG